MSLLHLHVVAHGCEHPGGGSVEKRSLVSTYQNAIAKSHRRRRRTRLPSANRRARSCTRTAWTRSRSPPHRTRRVVVHHRTNRLGTGGPSVDDQTAWTRSAAQISIRIETSHKGAFAEIGHPKCAFKYMTQCETFEFATC